jgi:hypothetical protein
MYRKSIRVNSLYISLPQLVKTLGPYYYFLHSLFNKIRDKGKTVSAWKREDVGGEGGEMTQTLYAHMHI